MIDWTLTISILSFGLATASFVVWYWTWKNEHRPRIVSWVDAEPHEPGAINCGLTMYVKNVGCRYAKEIGFNIDEALFNDMLDNRGLLKKTLSILNQGHRIPVLLPEQTKTHSFSFVGRDSPLEQGISFDLEVSYSDERDRKYLDVLRVAVPSNNDFGSASWGNEE